MSTLVHLLFPRFLYSVVYHIDVRFERELPNVFITFTKPPLNTHFRSAPCTPTPLFQLTQLSPIFLIPYPFLLLPAAEFVNLLFQPLTLPESRRYYLNEHVEEWDSLASAVTSEDHPAVKLFAVGFAFCNWAFFWFIVCHTSICFFASLFAFCRCSASVHYCSTYWTSRLSRDLYRSLCTWFVCSASSHSSSIILKCFFN